MPVITEKDKEPKLTPVEQWRKEKFEDMDFTSLEAEKLATKRDESDSARYAADTHRVKKMLAQGCSHKKVLYIFI